MEIARALARILHGYGHEPYADIFVDIMRILMWTLARTFVWILARTLELKGYFCGYWRVYLSGHWCGYCADIMRILCGYLSGYWCGHWNWRGIFVDIGPYTYQDIGVDIGADIARTLCGYCADICADIGADIGGRFLWILIRTFVRILVRTL